VLEVVQRYIRTLSPGRGEESRTDGDLLAQFIDAGAQEAFTALLRRHGPMVLGVCRRVLHDDPSADDAFQAVFLVLFRRARFLDRRASLAGWLYTVACRAPRKVKTDTLRWRRWHGSFSRRLHADPAEEAVWRD